ncbi:MAG: dienelactone hydrolase family protein [Acidobacteria bacterium]|nr:dienelactone hydrolase family protein [Acidobacteriota bacterium]
MPEKLSIDLAAGDSVTAYLHEPPRAGEATLILAHGAGGNQMTPFMRGFARGFATRGVQTVTFNFVYSERRQRVPEPAPRLEACYRAVIAAVLTQPSVRREALFIGGKSMGGRIASQVAAADRDRLSIRGLVFLGYPLHPPGKPQQVRTAHLPSVAAPMLFVQGTRDPFGTPDELRPVVAGLASGTRILTVERGDHSFALPKPAGAAQQQLFEWLEDEIVAWIRGC